MQQSCGLVSLNVLFKGSFGLCCTDFNMKDELLHWVGPIKIFWDVGPKQIVSSGPY